MDQEYDEINNDLKPGFSTEDISGTLFNLDLK